MAQCIEELCTFQRFWPIVYVVFRSKDIRQSPIQVLKSSKNRTNVKIFWPPIYKEIGP